MYDLFLTDSLGDLQLDLDALMGAGFDDNWSSAYDSDILCHLHSASLPASNPPWICAHLSSKCHPVLFFGSFWWLFSWILSFTALGSTIAFPASPSTMHLLSSLLQGPASLTWSPLGWHSRCLFFRTTLKCFRSFMVTIGHIAQMDTKFILF